MSLIIQNRKVLVKHKPSYDYRNLSYKHLYYLIDKGQMLVIK